jgi:hypothetical protein
MNNEVNKKKQSRRPTLDDLERWFVTLWDARDRPYTSICDYAVYKLPNAVFAEKALEHIAQRLHECPAQSPMQLLRWCHKQIDKLVAKLNRAEKAERKNAKPLVYEQHGERIFVQLFDSKGRQHIWKFPASWLEAAKKLWPIYIRIFPDDKPYLAHKTPVVKADCSREQVEVPVHRLFLGLGAVRRGYDDAAEAESVDGSWLNFCDGNIRLTKGTDVLDHAFSLTGTEGTLAHGWVPAKAKVTTSREGSSRVFNRHELSVLSFLSGKYPEYEPKIICQD